MSKDRQAKRTSLVSFAGGDGDGDEERSVSRSSVTGRGRNLRVETSKEGRSERMTPRASIISFADGDGDGDGDEERSVSRSSVSHMRGLRKPKSIGISGEVDERLVSKHSVAFGSPEASGSPKSRSGSMRVRGRWGNGGQPPNLLGETPNENASPPPRHSLPSLSPMTGGSTDGEGGLFSNTVPPTVVHSDPMERQAGGR
jgi:hypothetical protein